MFGTMEVVHACNLEAFRGTEACGLTTCARNRGHPTSRPLHCAFTQRGVSTPANGHHLGTNSSGSIARAFGHDPEYPARRDNALQDAEGELAPTLSGLDVYEGPTYAVVGGHPGSHNSDSC